MKKYTYTVLAILCISTLVAFTGSTTTTTASAKIIENVAVFTFDSTTFGKTFDSTTKPSGGSLEAKGCD